MIQAMSDRDIVKHQHDLFILIFKCFRIQHSQTAAAQGEVHLLFGQLLEKQRSQTLLLFPPFNSHPIEDLVRSRILLAFGDDVLVHDSSRCTRVLKKCAVRDWTKSRGT